MDDPMVEELDWLLSKRKALRELIKSCEEHVPGPDTQMLLVKWKQELSWIVQRICNLGECTD